MQQNKATTKKNSFLHILFSQQGFSITELLIVLVIIGALFLYLFYTFDLFSIASRVNNAVVRSTMNKVVLSIESYRSSYNKIPNEEEFIEALNIGTKTVSNSCITSNFPDYECLFKPSAIKLPKVCDLSQWRNDRKTPIDPQSSDNKECFARYYAGPTLPQNRAFVQNQFRIYVPIWGTEFNFYVYDNLEGGKFYRCQKTVKDTDVLASVCKEI